MEKEKGKGRKRVGCQDGSSQDGLRLAKAPTVIAGDVDVLLKRTVHVISNKSKLSWFMEAGANASSVSRPSIQPDAEAKPEPEMFQNNRNDNASAPPAASLSADHWKNTALNLTVKSALLAFLLPEKPQFSSLDENPVLFLNQIEKCFDGLRDFDINKFDIVKTCLGGVVEEWMDLCGGHIKTYDEFRNLLLETFWSPEDQYRYREEILQEGYDPKNDLTMVEYFIHKITLLKTTQIPGFTETNNISDLLNHFSPFIPSIIDLWSVYQDKTYLGAIKFVKRLEGIYFRRKEQNTRKSEEALRSLWRL